MILRCILCLFALFSTCTPCLAEPEQPASAQFTSEDSLLSDLRVGLLEIVTNIKPIVHDFVAYPPEEPGTIRQLPGFMILLDWVREYRSVLLHSEDLTKIPNQTRRFFRSLNKGLRLKNRERKLKLIKRALRKLEKVEETLLLSYA